MKIYESEEIQNNNMSLKGQESTGIKEEFILWVGQQVADSFFYGEKKKKKFFSNIALDFFSTWIFMSLPFLITTQDNSSLYSYHAIFILLSADIFVSYISQN